MKIFNLAFLILLCACSTGKGTAPVAEQKTDSGIVSQYHNQIKTCDEQFAVLDSKSISTGDIISATTTLTECYRKIAFDIIDSNYSQNSTEMKQNFDDYIRTSGKMTGFIKRPDSCYPYCGTIVSIESAGATCDAAKHYLDKLLNQSAAL